MSRRRRSAQALSSGSCSGSQVRGTGGDCWRRGSRSIWRNRSPQRIRAHSAPVCPTTREVPDTLTPEEAEALPDDWFDDDGVANE